MGGWEGETEENANILLTPYRRVSIFPLQMDWECSVGVRPRQNAGAFRFCGYSGNTFNPHPLTDPVAGFRRSLVSRMS